MADRPDLDRIFAHLASPPAAGDSPLAAMRAMVEDYGMGASGDGLVACRRLPTMIGSLEAEWLVPPGASTSQRIVHLHGGGWSAGSISSHRAFAAEIAYRTGQAVLLPAYRLAPEHPFPAGLDDAMAALAHAQVMGPEGLGTSRVAVSGDSAGGNLAVAVAARCIEEGLQVPLALWLVSPFLAPDLPADRFAAPLRDPVVDPLSTAGVAQIYAPGVDVLDPRISVLRTTAKTLADFPPVLLQASGAEALREQAVRFADAVWKAGAWLKLSLWPGMPHVWPVFVGILPEAEQAIIEASAFLKQPQP